MGEVRGYFYFCDPATPFFPGWSYFGSRNWHNGDGTPWPEFGELEDVRQRWRDGSFPTTKPDLILIGTPEQIAGDLPCPPDPPTQLIAGVDLRCWKQPYHWVNPAAGGDVVGDVAEHAVGIAGDAAGGDVVGDVAEHAVGIAGDAAGGDVVGQVADHVFGLNLDAAGGDLVGDVAGHTVGLSGSAAGGDLVGSSADHGFGQTSDAAGGDVVGSFATEFAGFREAAAGGVKVGSGGTHSFNGGAPVADTLFIHDDGIKANIDSITGKTPTPIGAGVFRLFQNNLADDKTKVLGNFTEATFPGYAPITPGSAAWGAGAVAGNVATAATPGGLAFTRSSPAGGPQNIYGWYLTDGANTKLYASARFAAAPVVLTNAGDNIVITTPLDDRSLN